VLKDFHEKQVHVARIHGGRGDQGGTQKKFPSNRERSEARAHGTAQVLWDFGISGNLLAEAPLTATRSSATTRQLHVPRTAAWK
jgi:hypothetical protein